MTKEISLRELKAQNAGEVEAETQETEVEETQVTLDPVETKTEETELEQESDEEESEESSVEVESWMQEDSKESEDGGFKPSPEAAAVRKKFKARLSQKDEELERLKAENEALKSGSQVKPQENLPPRPKLEDFDYDEAKHEAALDEWYDRKTEAKAKSVYQSSQTEAQQREAAERQQKALNDAIESHYSRVAELVEGGKISEERYTQAEDVVIKSLDNVSGGNGQNIAKQLIKTLNSIGEGSEKVMYQLGVNSAKRDRLIELMQTDNTGLAAATFLGQLQSTISSPVKRKSSAPKPMADVKGDAVGSTRADKMRKQYQGSTDIQARISLKRQAKAKGYDTTNW